MSDAVTLNDLLATPTPPDLRFTARAGCRSSAELTVLVAALLPSRPARTRDLVTGLVLCWHDHYDASHDCCQAHEGDADADYLHAILHRREGDAGNAGYWFRRVGSHPLFAAVAAAATTHGVSEVVVGGRLDPVALVQATLDADAPAQKTAALQAVQAAELRALLAAWAG